MFPTYFHLLPLCLFHSYLSLSPGFPVLPLFSLFPSFSSYLLLRQMSGVVAAMTCLILNLEEFQWIPWAWKPGIFLPQLFIFLFSPPPSHCHPWWCPELMSLSFRWQWEYLFIYIEYLEIGRRETLYRCQQFVCGYNFLALFLTLSKWYLFKLWRSKKMPWKAVHSVGTRLSHIVCVFTSVLFTVQVCSLKIHAWNFNVWTRHSYLTWSVCALNTSNPFSVIICHKHSK